MISGVQFLGPTLDGSEVPDVSAALLYPHLMVALIFAAQIRLS